MKDLIKKARSSAANIGARSILIALVVFLLTAGIAVYVGIRHVRRT